MRTSRFHTEFLEELLRRRTIATMPELQRALGTTVAATVFRKLKDLDYITSYSHRGRYYALSDMARFDEQGLWSFRGVGFSRHGTLVATLEALVGASEAGYFATELEAAVGVGVDDALAKLARQGRLHREKITGRYLYCSVHKGPKREQLRARKLLRSKPSIQRSIADADELSDELMAAIILFFGLLDEKQRRLYAGLESLKLGRGGDCRISELLGLDVKTIARGRRQLMARDVDVERIRKQGGGRKAVEKKLRRSSPRSKNS